MGIASLVLGIVSIILIFVPLIWIISIVTAIVGLILGIISLIKKDNKVKCIVGIVLSVLTILLSIFNISNALDITENTTADNLTTIITGKQETVTDDELKSNIIIKNIGITKNGDFAFSIENNNNQNVYIDTINIVFKDENGNFMKKESCDAQFFGVKANSKIINYVWGYDEDFSKYPNYEFEIELSSDWIIENETIDNFEIISNNTGEQISVQVKNNNDFNLSSIKVMVAYYNDDKIVGCVNGYANDTTTSANGTAYINVDYPEDSEYDEVQFDDYEIFLISADK